MTCPQCGGDTKVTNSRHDEAEVRRRRECLECGYRFSTVEIDMDLYDKLMNTRAKAVKQEVAKVLENTQAQLYKILT